MIEVESLSRTYGASKALDEVSFRIERGGITGLLGPNGAGKSTTMRILTGLLAPTGGRARVDGHDVVLEPVEARRRIGYLPEGAPLYEEMRVEPLLAFVGRARGLGPAERATAISRVAGQCGLEDRLGQRIGTLSRGYRQRVGLAAALLHDPPILVLDEPTTGLDPNQVAELRALIRRLAERRTVILSTHILSEVEVTCDRVLILHRGRLVADQRTEEALAASRGQVLALALGPSKVVADHAALAASLLRIPGVTAVRPSAAKAEVARLEVRADRDVRADVFRWAVDGGHVIVELTPLSRSLEEVFASLTAPAG